MNEELQRISVLQRLDSLLKIIESVETYHNQHLREKKIIGDMVAKVSSRRRELYAQEMAQANTIYAQVKLRMKRIKIENGL